jgi:hypothetical protein
VKLSRKVLNYSIAVIVSLCCICLTGVIAINYSSGSILSTPTPISLLPQSNLSTIIAQTASVAQTQTMLALPPTPLATATLASMIETNPTATIFIFELQTEVAQPTNYIFLTNTPFSLATQPALPPQSAACSCSGDTLNCDDFNPQTEAQACMDYCIAQGAGDIHHLDNNNNGIACEDF